jgi:hypothetical protein
MIKKINYRDYDGRIYAHKKGILGSKDFISECVSPYDIKFEEQIEDGIKNIVFAFLNKNYMPVSSCEGHANTFNSSHITLAFPFSEDRYNVVDKLKNIPFVTFKFFDNFFDIKEFSSYENEAETINQLFLKKHKRYYFLDIRFFEYKYEKIEWPYSYHFFNFLIPLNALFVNYLRKKYEKQIRNIVINIINSKEFPAYDK